jgi:hypothetical protein
MKITIIPIGRRNRLEGISASVTWEPKGREDFETPHRRQSRVNREM